MGRPKGSKNKSAKGKPPEENAPAAPVQASEPQPPVEKSARQKPLPGMEDRLIAELNEAALDYDDVKRRRMALTTEEVEAKKKVSDLMHAQKRTTYKHGNISIELVPEGEKVKVKVSAQGTEPDEDGESDVPDEVLQGIPDNPLPDDLDEDTVEDDLAAALQEEPEPVR